MSAWPETLQPGSAEAVAHVAHVALVADARRDREAALLDNVESFLSRFVSLPTEHDRAAVVLWAAHTHLLDDLDSTPRLAFLSPEPGSGKSRALEVLELLVPRPLHVANVSPAALFRSVDPDDSDGRRTILYDEIDTVFGPKAKDNEDIRGLLNAGHRRATVLRCKVAGKNVEVVESPVYGAVALAGLGDLPDTLMTRSVVIRMRRRAPHERVEPFRTRLHEPQGHELRDQLAEWASRHDLSGSWPDMPAGIEDRAADVWEPLITIADAFGGAWPDRARAAAVAHVAAAQEKAVTLGVQLLTDLRHVFTTHTDDHLATEVILSTLHNLEESPWADLRGKPLDARGLARRLNQYGVSSRNVRVSDRVVKGYSREDLHDPWQRYLPAPLAPADSATSATSATDAEVVEPDMPLWADQ